MPRKNWNNSIRNRKAIAEAFALNVQANRYPPDVLARLWPLVFWDTRVGESPGYCPAIPRHILLPPAPMIPEEVIEREMIAIGYKPDEAHRRSREPNQPPASKGYRIEFRETHTTR